MFAPAAGERRPRLNDSSASGSLDGGSAIGDQNNARARYGWDSFVRPQRFILSWVYQFPEINGHSALVRKALGGWSLAGVTTIQSGQRLAVTATNVQNLFGSLADRAPASASGCGDRFVNSGSVQKKLNNYINSSCFDLSNYAVIGDDGIGTAFGTSGIGEVVGPNQNNWDLSLAKSTNLTVFISMKGTGVEWHLYGVDDCVLSREEIPTRFRETRVTGDGLLRCERAREVAALLHEHHGQCHH